MVFDELFVTGYCGIRYIYRYFNKFSVFSSVYDVMVNTMVTDKVLNCNNVL